MDEKHDCSIHSDKLCCHSAESILLVLSKSPWPHTIKEISDLTNLHRNTVRESLKKLKDTNLINSLGLKNPADKSKKQYGIEQYFYESISDHYRTLVQTMADSMVNQDMKQKRIMAKQLGYNLVKTRLNDIFRKLEDMEIPLSSHLELEHALLHLKIAYPFTDLYLDPDNKLIFGTKFQIKTESIDHEDHGNSFTLKLNPCLCLGEFDLACYMVEGALEGIIKLAIKIDSSVIGTTSGHDGDGQFCTYQIKTFETDPKANKFDKDNAFMKLSQHSYQMV